MAELKFDVDISKIEKKTEFELIPDSECLFEITNSSLDDTKDGTGKSLNLTAKVMEGRYKNRLVFIKLNLVNSSKKATEFAWSQFQALWTALGFSTYPSDSTKLHGISFIGLVGTDKGKNGYKDKNVIKKYSSYDPSLSRPAKDTSVKNTNISFASDPYDDVPF